MKLARSLVKLPKPCSLLSKKIPSFFWWGLSTQTATPKPQASPFESSSPMYSHSISYRMIFIRPSHSVLRLIKLYLFLVHHFISFDEAMAKASHAHKRSTSGSHLRVIYIHSCICSAPCAWVASAWHEHIDRGTANQERQFFLCYLSSVQKREARFEYRCFRIGISPTPIHYPLLPTKFLRPFEPTTLPAAPPQQNTALLCHSEAT